MTGNLGQTHWYHPARWLYFHLLDGDLASNTLSWQWIVGSFSHKKYYANQENLNKYSDQKQIHSWLNVPYEQFETMGVPKVLEERIKVDLSNDFPKSTAEPMVTSGKPLFLYSIWNLDATWRADEVGVRVLWIDPQMHTEMALSPKRWQFITHWAGQITGLKIFVGSEAALFPQGTKHLNIITREYPETQNWPGLRDEREWLYPRTSGYFKNFFSFWKQAQAELPGLRKLHQPHKV